MGVERRWGRGNESCDLVDLVEFRERSTLVSRAAPHKQKPRAAEVGLRPCDSSGGNTEREAAGRAGLTLRDFGLQLRSFPHISTIKISQ